MNMEPARRQGKSLWGWALIKTIAADNGGVPERAIAVGDALWLPTGEVITYPRVDTRRQGAYTSDRPC